MALRNVHTVITEDYGYPYWVSYVSFAVATIILGAILGLVSDHRPPFVIPSFSACLQPTQLISERVAIMIYPQPWLLHSILCATKFLTV